MCVCIYIYVFFCTSIATLCLQTQVVCSLEILSPSRHPSAPLVFLATHPEKVAYPCCLYFIATFPPPVTSMSPSSPQIYSSFPRFPPPSFVSLVTTFAFFLLLLSRFSRVRLCATPETEAHQAPLSLGFSRQEYWSGVPLPSPSPSFLSFPCFQNSNLYFPLSVSCA